MHHNGLIRYSAWLRMAVLASLLSGCGERLAWEPPANKVNCDSVLSESVTCKLLHIVVYWYVWPVFG